MDIVGITEENRDDFLPFLGEDIAEEIKRVYVNGLGAIDEEGRTVGAFIYELQNSESEEDTRGRICLIRSEGEEISESLEKYYSATSVNEDQIVESFYLLEEEAEARILTEAGFSFEKREDEILTVTLADLSASKLGKKKRIPGHVGNIEDLSVLQFRDAVKQILFKGHTGILEDIPYLPKSWFDGKVSACVSSGGKIPGLFLVRRTPTGILVPALLYAYGPESKVDVLYMLRYSVQQALQIYPPETKVVIHRKYASIRALTDNLLPNRSGEKIFFGMRKEQ